MSYGAIGVTVIGGIFNAVSANRNKRLAEEQLEESRVQRQMQQARLDQAKQNYMNVQFTNPFENMQNTFEDLTVNQQAANFQARRGAQTRANIMQNLRGAAGASGISGLAQALANQGAMQTAGISASIGQQESANQLAKAKGAAATQLAERQGQQYLEQTLAGRTSTILGMEMGQAAGANAAYQQAQQNLMGANIASQQNTANMFASLASGLASNENIGGPNNNIFNPN